jgi:hypothetical protein
MNNKYIIPKPAIQLQQQQQMMIPDYGRNMVPQVNNDNYLIVELLKIINQLPIEMGFTACVLECVKQCGLIMFINSLVRYTYTHVLFPNIYWCYTTIVLFIAWLFNYKSFTVEFDVFLNKSEVKSIDEYEGVNLIKISKFFGLFDYWETMTYYYYNSVPKLHIRFYNGRPYFLKTITPWDDSKNGKMLIRVYYLDTEFFKTIAEISVSKAQTSVSYRSIVFNDDKCIAKTTCSNPLIPIQNYSKLDNVICNYTRIQESLGYKNINPISIDGVPGLGKTSFMDYFSHKHSSYKLVYIDMISNYQTSFTTIQDTVTEIIENSTPEDAMIIMNTASSANQPLVIMIDELDKYIDLHVDYLMHQKKNKDQTDDAAADIAGTVGTGAAAAAAASANQSFSLLNGELGGLLNKTARKQRRAAAAATAVASPKIMKVETDEDMCYDNQCGMNDEELMYMYGTEPCGADPWTTHMKTKYNAKVVNKICDPNVYKTVTKSPAINAAAATDSKFLKKEILYRLMSLINMKVSQPTYLIFCTNNFTSLWNDLDEKDKKHLAALYDRFIQIHFEYLNKTNLIEILQDINTTFKTKIPDKYLEPDVFAEQMKKLPENLSITVRDMHHSLIRAMYDISQFVSLLEGEIPLP